MYLFILFFLYIGCCLVVSLLCRCSLLNSIVLFYLSFDKKEYVDNIIFYLFGLYYLCVVRFYYFFFGLIIVIFILFFCLKRLLVNFWMLFIVMLLIIFL